MRKAIISCIAFFMYLAAAKIGSLIQADSGYTPTIWPAAGVAVAAILFGGHLATFAIALAALLVNLNLNLPPTPAIFAAAGSTISAWLAAKIIRMKLNFDWGFNRPRDVMYFFATAVVGSPIISSIVCGFTLLAAGLISSAELPTFLHAFWIGDGLGILMVVPVVMIWSTVPARVSVRSRIAEFSAMVCLSLIITAYLFIDSDQFSAVDSPVFRRIFIVFPVVLWSSLRFGPIGLSTVMLMISTMATYSATRNMLVPGAISIPQDLYTVQLGIGINTMTGLLFAASLSRTRANEERFRSMFERSDVPMGEVDIRGKLISINDKFCELTEYSREELLTMRFSHITHPDDIAWEAILFQKLLAKEISAMSVEKRYITKSGRVIWIAIDATLIQHGPGKEPTAIAVIQNINQRKIAEEAAEQAQKIAEEANQAKSDFLASMSHEIRTPLGVILGFSELLRDDACTSSARREFTETIHRNALELGRLVDDILDLSKIEAGKLDLNTEDISIKGLLSELKEMFQPSLSAKGISLEAMIDDSVPAKIKTDPTRLRQILVNLISNGIKYTTSGKITVNASMQDPFNHNILKILVTDTGSGIRKDDVHLLFQPFRRCKQARQQRIPGTGLGLVLSRRLARMLGGDVVLAHTQVGFGSTFKVTIQTERSEFTTDQAHAQTESATLIQQPINKELSGLRILIAEDTPDQALLIKLLLTNLGAQVETAENGQDAVNMALHNDYTIVLMDMQMPILDGYQATATLRDKGFRRPVLALTAQAMKTDIRKCLDSGCSGHLSKPFSRETLVTAIRECLHANKA